MSRPEKLFYKRSEVCQMAGVQSHDLRTWETEFAIRPVKSKIGHCLYRRKDIDLLMKIKAMIYGEGLTISGARKRLEMMTPVPAGAEGTPVHDPTFDLLQDIRADLRALLTLLEGNDTNSVGGT